MTRPTPTQGAQSEAARVPRVSDRRVRDCALDPPSTLSDIALDLLDERRDHASARQASRDKDATIADLERRLAEAEREPTCDAIIESWRFQAETANARADALQARLTEAVDDRDDALVEASLARTRAAMAERRGFEACRDAAASIAALHYSTRHWQGTVKQVGGKIADAIRALAPAVPQEGETTP